MSKVYISFSSILAIKKTWWPRSTKPSAHNEATRSAPPWFNVGDITYSNINEYVKVLGEYNKDDVYIESSPGVEYELFYTDNNAKKVYTDPWILSDNTIEQIDRLKISLMALGYKLTGITNCNIYGSGDICKGNTYYIKYEKN